MKKWLLILGMITCMLGLTACGNQEKDVNLMPEQEAEQYAVDIVNMLYQLVSQNSENEYIAYLAQYGVDTTVYENAFASWKSASEEIGDYVDIIGITSNSMVVEEVDGENYPIEGVLTAKVECDLRDATLEIIYEDGMPVSITTNVEYTFGEKMNKAFLNTLLGMGTVFIVLILISLIISCFGIIPRIQAKLSKKPAKKETKTAAVGHTDTQINENEELSDDLELVAVIAAAIAASEGTSTDDFVVRSIRRAGNKWQRA